MQSTDTALTTLVGDHQWAVSEKKLFKDIVDEQTDAQTTDKGPSQKLTLRTLSSGELKKKRITENIPSEWTPTNNLSPIRLPCQNKYKIMNNILIIYHVFCW